MSGEKVLHLTPSELALLRRIVGFIEAGEVDGGPLEGAKHQQTTANLRVFAAVQEKVRAA